MSTKNRNKRKKSKPEPFDLSVPHVCSLCKENKMIDFESSLLYLDILCYDCARRIDQEYISYCESLIQTIVLEKPNAKV